MPKLAGISLGNYLFEWAKRKSAPKPFPVLRIALYLDVLGMPEQKAASRMSVG